MPLISINNLISKHILIQKLFFWLQKLISIVLRYFTLSLNSRKMSNISFKSSTHYFVTRQREISQKSSPRGYSKTPLQSIYLEIKPLIFVRSIDFARPMNLPEVTVGCEPRGPSPLPARAIVDLIYTPML